MGVLGVCSGAVFSAARAAQRGAGQLRLAGLDGTVRALARAACLALALVPSGVQGEPRFGGLLYEGLSISPIS